MIMPPLVVTQMKVTTHFLSRLSGPHITSFFFCIPAGNQTWGIHCAKIVWYNYVLIGSILIWNFLVFNNDLYVEKVINKIDLLNYINPFYKKLKFRISFKCFNFFFHSRETDSIEQHAEALVGLLESCLNHNLKPSSKDEDPPHAKISSDIISCIFLVC